MNVNASEELRLLAEIARWTRESALPIVRARVDRLLDSDGKRFYDAIAEGTASLSAAKATGVNHNEIRKWVDEWEAEGIAVPDAKPPRAIFTLRELGIPAAPARTTRKQTGTT